MDPAVFIYLLTNLVNSKYYVGQTRAKTAHKRFLVHASQARQGNDMRIHAAMRKHGVDAFTLDLLAEAQSLAQLDLLEQLWIACLNSQDFNVGYNASPGGNARSKESIEKGRLKLLGSGNPNYGKHWPEDIRQRMSAGRRGKSLGHTVSDETRAKQSARALARPNLVEIGRKMGLMRIGKINSQESNTKRSNTLTGKYAGANSWMLGRTLPEETKEKLRAASLANGSRPPSWRGRKHTPESIEKMRAARLNRTA